MSQMIETNETMRDLLVKLDKLLLKMKYADLVSPAGEWDDLLTDCVELCRKCLTLQTSSPGDPDGADRQIRINCERIIRCTCAMRELIRDGGIENTSAAVLRVYLDRIDELMQQLKNRLDRQPEMDLPAFADPPGGEKLRFCPVCGSIKPEDQRFCCKCGSPMEAADRKIHQDKAPGSGTFGPARVFCFNCGTALDPDARFCHRCGCSVTSSTFVEDPPFAPLPSYSMSTSPPPCDSKRAASSPVRFPQFSIAKRPAAKKQIIPPLRAQEVQFRGAAPMVIRPGRYFTVKIMMYRERDYQRADRESETVGTKRRITTSGLFRAKRNQIFQIRLQSAAIELDEAAELCWNGKYAAAEFQVFLPEDYDREQLRLIGRIYDKLTPLTDLVLILDVSSGRPGITRLVRKQRHLCEKTSLRTAFISYSSADRSEVSKRIQGMESVRPDMDIFFDRKSLVRGEEYEPRIYQEIRERDLFFLFWSRNAAASEWVEKELTYALDHKNLSQIEPICLERIENCPLPDKLKHLHFWDWTLNYIDFA